MLTRREAITRAGLGAAALLLGGKVFGDPGTIEVTHERTDQTLHLSGAEISADLAAGRNLTFRRCTLTIDGPIELRNDDGLLTFDDCDITFVGFLPCAAIVAGPRSRGDLSYSRIRIGSNGLTASVVPTT